jgi:hypothetical protein
VYQEGANGGDHEDNSDEVLPHVSQRTIHFDIIARPECN